MPAKKAPSSRNPAGRPKDLKKREAIVRAASALFFARGFEATSMLQVAKKASVSKLTIYSHFSDKDDLFKAVVSEKCNRTIMPETYMALADKSAEEGLHHIARNFASLIFSEDAIRLQRIMQAEGLQYPQMVKLFYEAGPKRVRENFARLLTDWNKQKKLKITDIPRAAEHFFSLVKGETHMRVMLRLTPPPPSAEIEKHIKAAVAVFLAAYKK
jgi:TetR/AcrR family transcriptional repressor of mexJK operon